MQAAVHTEPQVTSSMRHSLAPSLSSTGVSRGDRARLVFGGEHFPRGWPFGMTLAARTGEVSPVFLKQFPLPPLVG